MNNFNPSNYINRLITNIANNHAKILTSNNEPINYQNTQSTLSQANSQNVQNKTLSPELKMTPMEVEQSAKYVKELLNMPKEITQIISQMASNKTMTTAQNVQLLLLLSSGKIDLNQLAQYLNENSKAAMQKLVQVVAQNARMGVSDTNQLRELINTLGLVSASNTDPASTLKNFILLYLPWLPLNADGGNLDFDIDITERKGSSLEDGLESITILIQTMNFSNIKATLELMPEGRVEIMLNCTDTFPKEKVLSVLKKESEDLNIQTGLIVEVTKKEEQKEDAKKQSAQISATSSVSPQLVLMAHSVIKIIFKIDKDFSVIK